MATGERECEACEEGTVRRWAHAGRTYEYRRGLELPIPEDLALEECDRCGELYLDEAEADALREAMRKPYLEWQASEARALVDRITHAIPGITQRQLERALGVTATYLSHVLKGRKEASQTLMTLLEEFALHPRDVVRKLELKPWRSVPSAKRRRRAVAKAARFRR